MSQILVVIDYQKDFVDGALGFSEAAMLEDKIYDKVDKYLSKKGNVFFTFDTHFSDYAKTREGKNIPIPHCLYGTEGWQLYGKLQKYSSSEITNTYRIIKKTFGSKSLPFVVDSIIPKVSEIEICGVVTNMCVISNAVILQSHFPEARIMVNAGCCASFDKELHEKALDVMLAMNIEITDR